MAATLASRPSLLQNKPFSRLFNASSLPPSNGSSGTGTTSNPGLPSQFPEHELAIVDWDSFDPLGLTRSNDDAHQPLIDFRRLRCCLASLGVTSMPLVVGNSKTASEFARDNVEFQGWALLGCDESAEVIGRILNRLVRSHITHELVYVGQRFIPALENLIQSGWKVAVLGLVGLLEERLYKLTDQPSVSLLDLEFDLHVTNYSVDRSNATPFLIKRKMAFKGRTRV